MKIWMIIPLLGALAVLIVLGERLIGRDAGERDTLPSALIGRDVPGFELPGLGDKPGLAAADLKSPGVKIVNVWASWCGPCRIEHPKLVALAAEGVTVYGLNYKDAPENAAVFLEELGDPYTRIGVDERGRVGIDFGVYGVPETFVVDAEGKIRYKLVGPILDRNINRLREEIKKAGTP